MLHTGSFDERFDYSDIDDDREEEVDNYIKGPDDLNPNICRLCEKYELKTLRYGRKDTEIKARYCKNCGYLCIRCGEPLPDPPRRSRKPVIKCSNEHCPFS